jgi:putative tricarboxylic transport membrane protein
MRKHDFLSSIIFFGIGFLVILFAPSYELGGFRRPGPGLIPFITGIFICFFSMVTFFQAYISKGKKDLDLWSNVRFRNQLFVIMTLFVYALILEKIGFLISTFFLILFLMRFVDPVSWFSTLLGSGLASILSYLLFETWLKTQLPKGIFGF